MVLLQPDPFLSELTNMYERSQEKGSVWVTFKRSCLKSKAEKNKLESKSAVEYRCLVRATDGKKKISTSATRSMLGEQAKKRQSKENQAEGQDYEGLSYPITLSAKDHLRFQASYATVLRVHMHALKKRERKDKKKAAEAGKKDGVLKDPPKKQSQHQSKKKKPSE